MKEVQNPYVYVEIQRIINSETIPGDELIEKWVTTSLIEEMQQQQKSIPYKQELKEQELTIRIVDKDEIQSLNKNYRHQDKATNVLSFSFEAPEQLPLLGDIVICHDIVVEEAKLQQKSVIDHWAHMVIHGVLHLKGYDHIKDAEADTMEALEIHILEQLGIDNPYG